jgi:HSP20 family molecular chaperone IbpA
MMQTGFADLDRTHREMIDMLRDSTPGQRWVSARLPKIWRPPTDVYETEEAIFVRVEVAGMQERDFQISLNGRKLSIGGVRHDPADKLGFQQMEIQYGPFETDIDLPGAVQEDRIEATYEGGFLLVHLPKAEARRIPVTNT